MSSDVLNIPEEERELLRKTKKHGLPRPPNGTKAAGCSKHIEKKFVMPVAPVSTMRHSYHESKFKMSLLSPPKAQRKNTTKDCDFKDFNELSMFSARNNQSMPNLFAIKPKPMMAPTVPKTLPKSASQQMFYTQQKLKPKKQANGYSKV